MRAGKKTDDSDNLSNPAHRTTFRPPWVREGGPQALPTPTAPWTLKNRRESTKNVSENSEKAEHNPLASVQLRKTNIQPKKEPQDNGAKETFFQKPALKPVPQREKTPPKKDHRLHNLPTLQKASDRVLRPIKPSNTETSSEEEETEEESSSSEEEEIDKDLPTKRNALVRNASMRRVSQGKIPPPPPGMPPPPPMMPGEVPKKPITEKQKARLDKLRSRPKNRPDWNNLLKEIESKKKLKHVVCNDRSQPLLPEAKAPDEHFLYKSEEPNVHNELLKQIESGIKLKKVKTNDRSKPMLDGLRKIRRQMTIEEQIQKSISMASMPPEEILPDEIDEMDDIDKVRDDLQSTKQMLAIELRNKEAQERENKRLLARIQNLEAELEKEKSKGGGKNDKANSAADDKVIKSLKKEVEEARKTTRDLENKYNTTAEELDSSKALAEDLKRQNLMLEKKLQEALSGKRLSLTDRKHSQNIDDDDDDEEFEEDEPEEDSGNEDTEEKRQKKNQKELKVIRRRLQNLKNKEDNAKKEREALKNIIKKHQQAMKDEKKKYKQLKKEVDKMASLMKDVEEEEEEKESEEEEEEEESSEEESESESDGSESEKSQSESEDAPVDKQKDNLSSRAKRHENRLNALKKGNFLLKTNAERLQDDLNKQKDLTASLQEDLDSVLSELG